MVCIHISKQNGYDPRQKESKSLCYMCNIEKTLFQTLPKVFQTSIEGEGRLLEGCGSMLYTDIRNPALKFACAVRPLELSLHT